MDAQTILERLNACSIPVSIHEAEQLAVYHSLLLDWNTRMDLTAVTEDSEMLDRHYVDSLMALTQPGLLPVSGRVIDVGTGAGFPGMPLAICCPDLRFTLLDSQQKRLNFLSAVIAELGLQNVTLVHARAEDGARNPELRASFDAAVARAVAPLPVLAEYLLPYVRVGGSALCWKGPSVLEEMTAARRATHLLGAHLEEPVSYDIPGRDWQHLFVRLSKNAPTPKAYPRKAGTPSKNPLGESAKS